MSILTRSARPTYLPAHATVRFSVWLGIFSAHALTRVANSYPNFSSIYTPVLGHNIEHHRVCHHLWLSIRCLCDNQLLSACALRTLTAQQTYLVRGSCHCDFFIDSIHSGTLYFKPICRTPTGWRLIRAACSLVNVFTDGQIAILHRLSTS